MAQTITAHERRNPAATNPRLTLTVEEAAELLGIGRNAAYEAVRLGTLPSARIGRRILIPRVSLDCWLERVGEADAQPRPATK